MRTHYLCFHTEIKRKYQDFSWKTKSTYLEVCTDIQKKDLIRLPPWSASWSGVSLITFGIKLFSNIVHQMHLLHIKQIIILEINEIRTFTDFEYLKKIFKSPQALWTRTNPIFNKQLQYQHFTKKQCETLPTLQINTGFFQTIID